MAVTTEDVQAATEDDFLDQADPYRRELLAHCYRMMGSVHDAEDLVQEVYIRAWKGFDKFEGRSSLRTWLHRIATTQCLTALESRARRPLPTGLGGPAETPGEALVERPEIPWLEPIPDDAVGATAESGADPADIVAAREGVRLALIAALQLLPPRQRAVLVLRDVLRWRASEVAELLGTSVAAVNSALQRARAQLAEAAPTRADISEPTDAAQRELLARYVSALQDKDVDALVALFAADAVYEMPPFATWFRGPAAIGAHLRKTCPAGPDDLRLLPIRANGRPGFATYLRDAGRVFRPFHIQVLEIGADGRIGHFAGFFDHRLYDTFGMPASLPADFPRS